MKLQVFENAEFGKVRTVDINGDVYFVAVDVCKALEIQNVTQAVGRLDNDEKAMFNIGLSGGETNCVNEAGLYRLIFASRKADAKKFQRWVYHEVLPAIRKFGVYATADFAKAAIQNPKWAIDILQELQKEQEKVALLTEENSVLNQQVAELQPKASYYDVILNCKNVVAISTIAKDYGFSACQLNRYLHEYGIQYKVNKTWVLYQKYANSGWTKTRTQPYLNSKGEECAQIHTYWTQKGRIAIYDTLKQHGILPLIDRG